MSTIHSLLEEERPLIMGVLNVTPDSFFDGNRYVDIDQAVQQAKRLVAHGADILDIGAESSRPGAKPVTLEEELHRLLPLLEKLKDEIHVPISIDTTKPPVAELCLRLGATLINDISALSQADMASVCSRHKATVVLMHMPGTPQTMQEHCHYRDVVFDVREYLADRVAYARRSGIESIIIDPGIGFGKTAQQNFQLLAGIPEFLSIGCPVLIGPSRKSFLATLPGQPTVEARLPGTIAAVTVALMSGARIVRVHDVLECNQAAHLVETVLSYAR